ncbi:hypothetical protein ABIA35_008261 [Catenulispora sp. MAP12-49]|uniref:Pycsar system effector family protein n=1 Tax=unclassified Catenulispora TaxID=414885 RepID=UPI003514577B
MSAPASSAATALPSAPRYLVDQAENAIDRADRKAAALGAASIALVTLLDSRGAVHHGSLHAAAGALVTAGRLSWVAAVLALAAAVRPRLRSAAPGTHPVSFFDLPEEYDADRLRSLVMAAAGDGEDWLLAQGHVLGRIAVAKFRMIQMAMALLVLSALMNALGSTLS